MDRFPCVQKPLKLKSGIRKEISERMHGFQNSHDCPSVYRRHNSGSAISNVPTTSPVLSGIIAISSIARSCSWSRCYQRGPTRSGTGGVDAFSPSSRARGGPRSSCRPHSSAAEAITLRLIILLHAIQSYEAPKRQGHSL